MVEKKKFFSRRTQQPAEIAKITTADIPGVPNELKKSLNSFMNDLSEFPTLFAESSQFPREDDRITPLDKKMMQPIFVMPLFRPDDPLYTPIYTVLTEKMQSKNAAQAHLAFVISHVALSEMDRDFDQTHVYSSYNEDTQSTLINLRNICHARPVQKSEKPVNRLSDAMLKYVKGPNVLPSQQYETRFLQRAMRNTQLSQLFASELYSSIAQGTNVPLHDVITEGLGQWRDSMFGDPYAAEVLVEGRMPWLDPTMQLGILLNHQANLLENGAEPKQFDASCQYFLQNKAVQQGFWRDMHLPNEERVITSVDDPGLEAYPTVVLFGRQQKQFESFLSTIPEEIRADKNLFGKTVTELMYLMTIAKTKGRDIDVATSVLTTVAAGATSRSLVEPVFAIATDKKPGVLFRTNRGVVAGALWHNAEESPTEKIHPQNVLYESTAPRPPVVDREVVTPIFVREEKPHIMTDGVTSSAHWGELLTLGADAQEQLLAHIGEQLVVDPMQQKRLLELAVQEPSPNALRHTSVIFPLLGKDHPLRVLQEAGIICVERQGRDVSIIVDPIVAGVETATHGDRLRVSMGLSDSGELTVATDAMLETALMAVIKLSLQRPQLDRTGKKIEQRMQGLRDRVTQWNSSKANPTIELVDFPTSDGFTTIIPLTAEEGVVGTITPRKTK